MPISNEWLATFKKTYIEINLFISLFYVSESKVYPNTWIKYDNLTFSLSLPKVEFIL